MSGKLKRRVSQSGGNHKQAMQSYTAVQPSMQTTGGAASPTGADVMPLASVVVYPEPGGTYSTIGYKGHVPLFTEDGAVIPATSPGRWAQLVMAGRP